MIQMIVQCKVELVERNCFPKLLFQKLDVDAVPSAVLMLILIPEISSVRQKHDF